MGNSHYSYDVFISYSHTDKEWVQGWLLPRLEANGLRVCVDFRDFDIGVPSLVNMERAVEISRHTIVVLTPAWVESEWTEFEELLTQTDDPASRRRRLLPLLLQPCQPPRRISMLTYADFTQQERWESQVLRVVAAAMGEICLSEVGPLLERLLAPEKFEVQGATRIDGEAQPGPILRFSFDHLIETHTRLFAGRESFLEAIIDFIKTNSSGYIFVEALSGYGKTSLLAKLVQNSPHFAYHFISQAYKSYGSDFDPTEMQSLLLNLCEQLETGKEKSNKHHPPKARFHGLLRSSPSNGPRVVVIDAEKLLPSRLCQQSPRSHDLAKIRLEKNRSPFLIDKNNLAAELAQRALVKASFTLGSYDYLMMGIREGIADFHT